MTNSNEWYSQKDAARLLGVTLNQLKYYINTGKLQSGTFYGRTLVTIPPDGLKLRKYVKKAKQ